MAMRVVDDPISQAMTATEKEIAAGAWGDEDPVLDETGDRTIEQMGEGLEGQHEPDDDDDETEDDESEDEAESEEGDEDEAEPEVKEPGEAKPAVKAEGDREGRVPPGRLREAAERARAAEAERDVLKSQAQTQGVQVKQLSDTLAQMQRDLAELRRAPPPAKPAEPAKPETPPDFFEDPNGFITHTTKPLVSQIEALQTEIRNTRFQTSLEMAHTRHGDAFTKAFEASQKLNPANPDDLETGRRIFNSPNPGEALVAWHRRNETLREVGDDPTKYRERIAAETREALMKDPEFRKQLVESLRAEAATGADGKPNTQVRLPKSLNGAAGGNRRDATMPVYDDNDAAIAAAAWVDR